MKTTMQSNGVMELRRVLLKIAIILTVFLLLWILLLLFGCTATDRVLLRPGQVTTNQIVTPAPGLPPQVIVVTNEHAVVLTQWLASPPLLVTNQQLVTNYVVNPVLEKTAETIGGLPLPWAGLAGSLIGLGLSSYAAIRNRKIASALVQGIEAGREILKAVPGQKLDEQFMEELVSHQRKAGVQPAVSRLVDRLT